MMDVGLTNALAGSMLRMHCKILHQGDLVHSAVRSLEIELLCETSEVQVVHIKLSFNAGGAKLLQQLALHLLLHGGFSEM
jgi:hypothetical protein